MSNVQAATTSDFRTKGTLDQDVTHKSHELKILPGHDLDIRELFDVLDPGLAQVPCKHGIRQQFDGSARETLNVIDRT